MFLIFHLSNIAQIDLNYLIHTIIYLYHLEMDLIFKYLVLGFCETKKSFGKTDKETIRKLLEFFSAVDTAKHSSDVQEIARLVEIHHLNKDHLCTKLLKEKQVM